MMGVVGRRALEKRKRRKTSRTRPKVGLLAAVLGSRGALALARPDRRTALPGCAVAHRAAAMVDEPPEGESPRDAASTMATMER
jgi:hypothetical protein